MRRILESGIFIVYNNIQVMFLRLINFLKSNKISVAAVILFSCSLVFLLFVIGVLPPDFAPDDKDNILTDTSAVKNVKSDTQLELPPTRIPSPTKKPAISPTRKPVTYTTSYPTQTIDPTNTLAPTITNTPTAVPSPTATPLPTAVPTDITPSATPSPSISPTP